MGKGKIYEQGLDRSTANFTQLSPLSFIGRTAAVYPDHVSVIHGQKRFTWSETYARCRRLAGALAKREIGVGDTVTVIGSNTSTILIGRIAEAVARPERFLGVHFSNPAPFIPGVEVIAHAGTDPAILPGVEELVRAVGKQPARISDADGFVLNRLQYALFSEASQLVDEGVASLRSGDHARFRDHMNANFEMRTAIFDVSRRDRGQIPGTPTCIEAGCPHGQVRRVWGCTPSGSAGRTELVPLNYM